MAFALLCHDIALRLKERRVFLPESRIVAASVPNIFGDDFESLLFDDIVNISCGQMPDISPYVVYSPSKSRPGEPVLSTMLMPYAVGHIHGPEQASLELKMQRMVLANRRDAIDKLRIIPPGRLPGSCKPDFQVLDRAALGYLAGKEMLEKRLEEPWATSTMFIEPLQVRLYLTDLSRCWGGFTIEVVDVRKPGLQENYLR